MLATAPTPRLVRWVLRPAAVLAGVLVLLALETHRRMVRLGDTHPPQGALVRIDGVQLHYVRAGSGPPVLLIHGSPGLTEDWRITAPGKRSVFDDLAQDHTVVALDRPGYGWSALPDGRPTRVETQADLVAGFVAAVGLAQPTVVGHSYGGALALATTVRHPEAVGALVHVAGIGYPTHADAEPLERLLAAPVIGPLTRWCVAPIILPSQVRAGLVVRFAPDPLLPEHAAVFSAFLGRPHTLAQYGAESVWTHASAETLSPRYQELTIPVTIILGSRERSRQVNDSARRLAEDVPGATVVEVPNVNHMIPHVRPQLVAAEVRKIASRTAAEHADEPAAP